MGRGLGGFSTTSLIDCHVNKNRTRLPVLQHLLRNELRCCGTGDENATDHEISRSTFILNRTLR